MVYTKINNWAVWERFLQDGTHGYDYQAIVHCKEEAQCRQIIHSSHVEIIPSVETRYCADLVTAMNALLRAALLRSGQGSAHDKFVFLSDSTLPTKPFGTVWARLTANSDSDFCIFPRNEWAQVPEGLPGGPKVSTRVAVKHHQWIVLNRRHAEASIKRPAKNMDLMRTLQLNIGLSNTGCLDEFWHFNTAYPDLHLDKKTEAQVDLEDLGGRPLRASEYEVQGRCDTFVHWVRRAEGISNNVTVLAKALADDAGTGMVPPTQMRPASVNRLSTASLLALRRSDFLFMRKVEDGAAFSGCETLDEAFAAVIFAERPQELLRTESVWRGDGVWLDNRQAPVAISSLQGSVRLVGSGTEMQATGYYCGDKLHVTFVSGYQATAVLSLDGAQMSWDNGVVWPRTTTQQQR